MASAGSSFARASLIACLFLVIAGPAEAVEQRIVLPVIVNEVPKGDLLIILDGEDAQLRVGDLEQAGLSGFGGERIRRGAEEWVRMSTIPDVTWRLDEEALLLRIQAAPSLLGSSTQMLLGNAPRDIEYATNPSAFLNYSLTSVRFEDPGISAEIGASAGNRFATTTFTRSSGGTPVRGLSRFVIDQPDAMTRWTFGDTQITTDPLGGGDLLGGITYSRDFSLQPYFVRYPSFDFEGAATTPSEVEIYVNGVLTERRRVDPGEFRLEHLPITAGSGETRVVVRDAFGREQVYASPYYYSTLNLGEGISDYAYSVGFRRDRLGTESFEYGDAAFVGVHRKGITQRLTVGGRLEATDDLISGGGSLTAALPFGEVEALAGVSEAEGQSGTAAALTYRWLARKGSIGGTLRTFSDRYANLSLAPSRDRVSHEGSIFAGYRIGRGSITTQVTLAEHRDRGEETRVSFNANYTLTRNMTLFVSAGRGEIGGESTTDVFAGLSLFLNRLVSASLGVARREGQTVADVDIQKPLPVGTGYGYRVKTNLVEGQQTSLVAAQYQSDFGRYEVTTDPGDTENALVTASGGLVWIGNRVLATRAVQQSYALARVGVPDVRIYASNLEVGKTDAKGDLLIPNLLPYYANRIRIEDKDVPLAYEVAKVEELVAPPNRGGGLVEFPVQKIQTAFGTLQLFRSGESIVPEFGQLTVESDKRRWDSPIGRGGAFYLENVPAGTYDATVLHKTGVCAFRLTIPSSDEQMLKLGELTCVIK